MRRNLFALIVLALILVLFPAAIFAHRAAQDAGAGVRVIEIQARMPEAGGFSPDRLELVAGETVKLRIVSPDVVHGFLIPQLDIDVNEVYPGKPVEVTITPQKPGRFAFACTRWCSVNHWRMRGVIEVLPAAGQAEGSAMSGNGVQQAGQAAVRAARDRHRRDAARSLGAARRKALSWPRSDNRGQG